MKEFSNEDYRRLIDAIEVKNQSKEFRATTIKSLKTFKNLVDIKTELENMRKSYDFFIVNALEDYGVKIDGIYKEFDQAWNKPMINYKKSDSIQNALNNSYKFAIQNTAIGRTIIVKKFWKNYKKDVKNIIKKYCQRTMNNEG